MNALYQHKSGKSGNVHIFLNLKKNFDKTKEMFLQPLILFFICILHINIMADGYKRPRIYNFFVMMFYNEMLRANLSTFYGRALLIQVDLLIRFQCQTRAEEDYEFLSDDAKNLKNKTKKSCKGRGPALAQRGQL